MDDFQLLIDLHLNNDRQGPGGDRETQQAMDIASLDQSGPLRIADIGCGTGASTLTLARSLDASVTAVDFLPEFIAVLENRARQAGLSGKISPLVGSMENLPFEESEFDVLWSEGAIYNMGFENGIRYWRRFLKPGGVLAVSEITWVSGVRPRELEEYWLAEYPEIGTASEKIGKLEAEGYSPIGYFTLPTHCWLESYYRPLQQALPDFLSRNGNSDAAKAIAAAEEKEIALYERFKDYYSYGFYIARNTA